MNKFISIIFALGVLSGCTNTGAPDAAENSIAQVMATQQQAWNDGDLKAFMQGYWPSEELRFASGDSYRFGWQTTLDNYIKGYPDKATMGQLKFELIDIDLVSDEVAIVFGRWHLTRASDQPHGLFTLVFEQKDGRWLITKDHTSSAK